MIDPAWGLQQALGIVLVDAWSSSSGVDAFEVCFNDEYDDGSEDCCETELTWNQSSATTRSSAQRIFLIPVRILPPASMR